MFEMGSVLLVVGLLMFVAFEISYVPKRKWGENHKRFF